ncbi:hypothetical protein GALL_518950 [mine drainage metagenome]|uniref:Uncharacterized protein n=1 Tax=mine drainage metagenome TaxID=410659 RepID=A0A1J5PSI8_9ZZZZ
MVLVPEHGLEADSAAGGVDQIIDHRQSSLRQGFLAVCRDCDRRERRNRLRLVYIGQLLFRRGENHGNRLDLGDRDDPALRRGVDDVADIDLTQADDAGNRCLDGGIVELGRGVGYRRDVGRDLRGQLRDRGALGVQLLPGRELAELDIALQIQIDICQIGLILLLLGLGLIERRLVWARIDLGEQIALIDQLAFLEGNLVNLAVDTGAHHDGVERLNSAQSGQIDRKVGFLDRGDGYPDRAGRIFRIVCRGRLVLAVESLPAEIAQRSGGQGQQNPTRCPRLVHFGLQIQKIISSGSSKGFIEIPNIICVHLMCKHTMA